MTKEGADGDSRQREHVFLSLSRGSSLLSFALQGRAQCAAVSLARSGSTMELSFSPWIRRGDSDIPWDCGADVLMILWLGLVGDKGPQHKLLPSPHLLLLLLLFRLLGKDLHRKRRKTNEGPPASATSLSSHPLIPLLLHCTGSASRTTSNEGTSFGTSGHLKGVESRTLPVSALSAHKHPHAALQQGDCTERNGKIW